MVLAFADTDVIVFADIFDAVQPSSSNGIVRCISLHTGLQVAANQQIEF
jgi:hypothetical protein